MPHIPTESGRRALGVPDFGAYWLDNPELTWKQVLRVFAESGCELALTLVNSAHFRDQPDETMDEAIERSPRGWPPRRPRAESRLGAEAMDGEASLLRALIEQPGLERQVRRRAGNRCEGMPGDRDGIPMTRCTKRGDDVDLYLTFTGWLSDEIITARDVRLLCDDCYERSETAEEFAHFAHLLSKD